MIFATVLAASIGCSAQDMIVVGTSLYPILKPKETIETINSACQKVARGDLVIFNSAQKSQPMVKIAVGLPGDMLEVTSANTLKINGATVIGPRGNAYTILAQRVKLVKLFEGTLNGYFLIGNTGSFDSSVIGVVSRKNIERIVVGLARSTIE